MSEVTTTRRDRARWLRPRGIALGLAGLILGAAGGAWATGAGPAMLAHHGCRSGMAREMAAFHVHRVLQQVDASEPQEQQVLAILDAQIARHQDMDAVHHELHNRFVAALSADTVDRAALESVRGDALVRIDEGSKELVKALADAADVLTPAQRRALAELAAEHLPSGS